MRRYFSVLFAAILASLCWTGCFPDDFEHERPEIPPVIEKPDQGTTDPDPGEDEDDEEEEEEEVEDLLSYDNLDAYDFLKNYVNRQTSPDFKLGAAVNAGEFISRKQIYDLAVDNLNEMTADNAFKWASVVRWDGSMDFSQVRRFLESAEQAGMTVYGHTLAWHAQSSNDYLRNRLKGKMVELPDGETGESVLVDLDFNDGAHSFIGWGNGSSRVVENGVFKISNPSAVQNWEAQFAYDMPGGYVKDRTYKMKFRIKGSASGELSAGFQITDGYKSAGEFPNISFGTQWKDVEVECICNAAGADRLVFSFGSFAGHIYIDDFRLLETGVSYSYEPLTPEEKKEILIEEMDRWIKGMMEATATRVSAWDAVNEAISGRDRNGDGFYELESGEWGSANNFYWQDYLGSEDYVRIVIEKARRYYAEYGGTAPLRLFINDYNLESDWDDNRKLKSLIHWIGIWESDGVTRIDGIGTQMHISYYENPSIQKSKEDHYVQMLQLMANTGKLVKISELDMGYVDMAGNDVKAAAMTDAQHRAMADYYRFIVKKYFEIVPPAQQYGITLWCPTDSPHGAWRGDEPVGLWDRNYNRKYAYAGFADGLRGK